MTSQYSSVESWRQEAKGEDRSMAGAAVGTLTEPIEEYKALRKKASNTRAGSCGKKHLEYELRVFMLLYFPAEAMTPPCHMFVTHETIVGVLKDRLIAMLNLGTLCTQDRPPASLIRLSTHQRLPDNSELRNIVPPLTLHEEIVLSFGDLPAFYPKAKITMETKNEVEEQNIPPIPEVPEAEPEVMVPSVGDIAEGSPEVPPGGVWLAEVRFANKKFQPFGDQKAIRFEKRLQLALFFVVGDVVKGAYVFVDKEWTVARSLDSMLSLAQIPNPNISTADPTKRLALYSLVTRKVLNNASKLADLVASGEGVVATTTTGLPAWVAAEALRYTNPAPGEEKEAKKKIKECAVM